VGWFIRGECAAATTASVTTPLQDYVTSKDIVQKEHKQCLLFLICDVEGAIESKGQGATTCMYCTANIRKEQDSDKGVSFMEDALIVLIEKAVEVAFARKAHWEKPPVQCVRLGKR
jgi:hypothetical protein